MFQRVTVFFAVSAALVACVEVAKDSADTSAATTATGIDTSPSGTPPTTATLSTVTYPFCEDQGGVNTWVYYAETDGWTGPNAVVNAWETGVQDGWNEEHTIESVAFDPNGWWDKVERDLQPMATASTFVADTNTVFECGVQDLDPTMTFAIRVYDLAGNYSDCVVFTSDTVGAGIQDIWNGTAPAYTPITAPSELSEANCVEWTITP